MSSSSKEMTDAIAEVPVVPVAVPAVDNQMSKHSGGGVPECAEDKQGGPLPPSPPVAESSVAATILKKKRTVAPRKRVAFEERQEDNTIGHMVDADPLFFSKLSLKPRTNFRIC